MFSQETVKVVHAFFSFGREPARLIKAGMQATVYCFYYEFIFPFGLVCQSEPIHQLEDIFLMNIVMKFHFSEIGVDRPQVILSGRFPG